MVWTIYRKQWNSKTRFFINQSKSHHNIHFKYGLIAMKKLNPSASTMGSFTDFNVWSWSLSEEEMVDFTRCRREMAGDLIPWNREDWTFTQGIGSEEYKVETVDFYSMCSPEACNLRICLK